MYLTIALTRLSGAEIVRIGGEDGVFIPIQRNLERGKSKGMSDQYFLKLSIMPAHFKKHADYLGKHLLPDGELDKEIETPPANKKSTYIAWGFGQLFNKKGSVVTRSDFDRIAGDDMDAQE